MHIDYKLSHTYALLRYQEYMCNSVFSQFSATPVKQ